MNLLKHNKIKKPKKPAIENYKISYIDKRSKKYHKIIMTGFVTMFGFVGGAYLYTSGASSVSTTSVLKRNPALHTAIVIAFIFTLVSVLVLMLMRRKK